MFPQLLSVQPTEKYKLRLRYNDGIEATADISYLAGRGIFRQWDENDLFFQVKIDPETNAIVWNDDLDLDPDNLYLQIRNLTFEQWNSMNKKPAHASD